MKTCALYGFTPKLEPFAGLTPTGQVALLQSWGNTAIFGGYRDPAFVEAAHAAGMKIYAEFGCFAGKTWWEQFPASRPVTEDGRPLPAQDWYYGVNPTTPQVRQRRLEALETLLTRYQVDGVWLDYIRWPCHWEVPAPYLPRTSFDPATLTRFAQTLSDDALVDSLPGAGAAAVSRYESEWVNWRCRQITSWVSKARDIRDRVRPGAVLGLFGVPWRLSDYDGAILEIVGQDYRALGQYVDLFSPMVYHKMCNFPVDWIAQVAQEVHTLTGKPVWPIIQSVDQPVALSAQEYGQALDVALNCSASDGVLVFTLQGALGDGKLAVTRAGFGRGK